MQPPRPTPIPEYWETSGKPGPPMPWSWRDHVDEPVDLAVASAIAFALIPCAMASRLAAIRRGRAPFVGFVVGLVTHHLPCTGTAEALTCCSDDSCPCASGRNGTKLQNGAPGAWITYPVPAIPSISRNRSSRSTPRSIHPPRA